MVVNHLPDFLLFFKDSLSLESVGGFWGGFYSLGFYFVYLGYYFFIFIYFCTGYDTFFCYACNYFNVF